MLGGTGNVIVRLSAVTIGGWDGLWPVALAFDRMDLTEPEEAFTKPEGMNPGRDRVFRDGIAFERRVLEANTIPRRWRDGIGPTRGGL